MCVVHLYTWQCGHGPQVWFYDDDLNEYCPARPTPAEAAQDAGIMCPFLTYRDGNAIDELVDCRDCRGARSSDMEEL